MSENRLGFLDDSKVLEQSIMELQAAMESGKTTAKEIVMIYLKRIFLYDQSGPNINSIGELNPNAIFEAESLDKERQKKGPRSLMHGIPVVIKDNIDTAGKMRTSAGTLALKDNYPAEDAFLVKKLKQAGAIILGKANLTEFANFMSSEMPNGYSSLGGQVLNPYGLGTIDVGGSSSGSGAAVAANLACAAIGTETSGSILSPSSQNSLVGIKPTVGMVSRSGIIPISHTQDTAGPMAKSVADAVTILSVIMGTDEMDAATQTIPPGVGVDFLSFFKKDGLKNAKIGVCREFYQHLNEEKLKILETAIKDIQGCKAVIIDNLKMPSPQKPLGYDTLFYEFKHGINAYLSGTKPTQVPVRTLKDVIKFNEENKEIALKYGQNHLEMSENTNGTLNQSKYLIELIRDQHYSQKGGIDAVIEEHKLDALLFPSNYGAQLPAKAGYPSITVPGGYTKDGEPMGVTFTGKAFTEHRLVELAYSFEQATKHRVLPKLV
ncbi:amidase family protein [Proteinivorax hydrogeniformans]|uniref:Amidase family protein n=1 Tax=Proteinivorax hydrogeniformans TaxID=1826727 RepID=A0AAU8HW60_9FIRM